MRRAIVIIGALAGLIGAGPAAAVALAQTAPATNGVVPTIRVETTFDDNIFGLPAATADVILRVRPGLTIGQTHSQANWVLIYTLDAERYQERRDLTAPLSRQNLTFTGSANASPRTSLTWTGQYISTLNQGELNTLTDLNVGRVRADRWSGGLSVRRALTPHLELMVGSTFERTQADRLGYTRSTGFDARLGVRRSEHADLFLRGDAHQFDFDGAGINGRIRSGSMSGGWSLRGRVTTISAQAGVQVSDGRPGPLVMFTAERSFDSATLTTSYTRSITTALGVAGTIGFDNAQIGLRRRTSGTTSPHAWQAGIRGGFAWNRIGSVDVRAIQFTVETSKPITDVLSLDLSYDRWLQQGDQTLPGSLAGRVLRNRLFFGMSLSPRSSR